MTQIDQLFTILEKATPQNPHQHLKSQSFYQNGVSDKFKLENPFVE